jgi:hypothetical protein
MPGRPCKNTWLTPGGSGQFAKYPENAGCYNMAYSALGTAYFTVNTLILEIAT